MKALVLGASGATGRLVVMQLLKKNIHTRVLLRAHASLSSEILNSPLIETVRGNIAEFGTADMAKLLQDRDAVVSCLGHNITFRGMFGKPRDLVCGTIKNICETVKKKPECRIKLILMSTTGYTNTTNGERNTCGEKIVLWLLKALLPPHRDNLMAADFLQNEIKEGNGQIEWAAVRPDTLVNEGIESAYEAHESPVRSPLFNAGRTSRVNVSHFISDLLANEILWKTWRFKMPVLYNKP